MAYIKIFLTNLGKLNEQELVGKWVDLPCDLDKELAEIGVSDKPDKYGRYYDEYCITDYETDIPGLEISEYSAVDELNKIAEQCENLDDSELAVLGAAMDGLNRTFEDSLDIVRKGSWRIWSGCDDMTDVAREYVSELGGVFEAVNNYANYFNMQDYMDSHGRYAADDLADMWTSNGTFDDYGEAYDAALAYEEDETRDLLNNGELDSDTVERYFDYESFGNELDLDGTFYKTDKGMVEFINY